MDVSILGTGLMGTALAQALIRSGTKVTVWNRTADRALPLAAAGATVAESPQSAIAASPLIVISLLNYEIAKDALQKQIRLPEKSSSTPQPVRRRKRTSSPSGSQGEALGTSTEP